MTFWLNGILVTTRTNGNRSNTRCFQNLVFSSKNISRYDNNIVNGNVDFSFRCFFPCHCLSQLKSPHHFDWLSEMPKDALLCSEIKRRVSGWASWANYIVVLSIITKWNTLHDFRFIVMGYNIEAFMQGLVCICLVVQCASYVGCCIICIICIICILIWCFDFLLFVCLPLQPHCCIVW